MANLRGSELIIIVLLVALLFGAKRMPDAARSIGRSLRIFKSEMKGMAEDDKAAAAVTAEAPVVTPLPTQPAPSPSPQPPAGA